MYILHERQITGLRAAIFDFDGTLSTLRCGWEKVMLPLMTEYTSPESEDKCRAYISESTGIQTIHQMKWLCREVERCGNPKNAPTDPWFFKEEYNNRLMLTVSKRRDEVIDNPALRKNYLVSGAEDFLKALKNKGVLLFAASGTDEEDVKLEAAALGLDGYFESINGAKPHAESCSKEAVISDLIERCGIKPSEILICGDGKVEIGLGAKNGCITLGVASDEENLKGINKEKEERLISAGADAITGDFSDTDAIISLLGL